MRDNLIIIVGILYIERWIAAVRDEWKDYKHLPFGIRMKKAGGRLLFIRVLLAALMITAVFLITECVLERPISDCVDLVALGACAGLGALALAVIDSLMGRG